MAFLNVALNEAADGIVVNAIQLHSGEPGPAGDQNVIADTLTTISLGAAVDGVRELVSSVDIDVPAGTVSHYTLLEGATVKAADAFSVAETYASPGIATISTAVLDASNPA